MEKRLILKLSEDPSEVLILEDDRSFLVRFAGRGLSSGNSSAESGFVIPLFWATTAESSGAMRDCFFLALFTRLITHPEDKWTIHG